MNIIVSIIYVIFSVLAVATVCLVSIANLAGNIFMGMGGLVEWLVGPPCKK